MIAHWMLYCVAAGALVAAAAAALEGAARSAGLPARWVWCGALVLSLAIPAAAQWLPRGAPAHAVPSAGRIDAALISPAAPADEALRTPAARWNVAALDRSLELMWLASALGTLVGIAVMAGTLALRRRRWSMAEVDGVRVLISGRAGPAVVGLFRPAIVLPRWVAEEMAPEERRLILAHEREHLRARDPQLLAMGVLAAALLPWSPAGWWMLRRLRLAMEVDCDARVLARGGDVRTYGSLLLEVGRRGSAGMVGAAALSEPAGFLERRIRVMTGKPKGGTASVLRMLGLGTAAVGALAALPLPERLAAQQEPAATMAQDTTPPRINNIQQIGRALERTYPPQLRDAGVEGLVVVRVGVAETGVVSDVQVLRSSHQAFEDPAVEAVRLARFRPARLDERSVAAIVEIPIQFTLPRGSDVVPSVASLGRGTSVPSDALQWDEAPVVMNIQEVARAIEAEYPPMLRNAGVAGLAVVRVRIDETGAVTGVESVDASHDEFRGAAERALQHLRFRPARKDGRPIAVYLSIPVQFTLPAPEAP
jgi:TonB family protein